MEKIIDELCNANPKFDKLTDCMINNSIDDGRFSIHMCNYFDTIGIRPCTNIHLEGFHRQVNARVRAHPDLWTWINKVKSLKESVLYRYEQEQAHRCTARPRKGRYIRNDNKLILSKKLCV